MTTFPHLFKSPQSVAALFGLSVLALCFASCGRSSQNVVSIDDDSVVSDVSESQDAHGDQVVPSAEEPAASDDSPLGAAPKFDAKGVSVDFTGAAVFNGFTSDEEKARQSAIKVVVGNGPISVEGLRSFAQFPQLVEFRWQNAQLPDGPDAEEAFKAFAALPKLKKVRLTGLKLENGSFPGYVLPALAKTANLVDLDISGAPVAAEDLAAVDLKTGFPALTKLNLYQTNAGDAGVEAVLPLADRLTWLNFDDAKLSPASAQNLAQFSNLTFLHVGRSALDDSCVDSLAKLSKLEKIHVTRSNVTEEGANKLRAALPNCTVVSVPEN